MDTQVKQSAFLGNGVVDTKSYLPFVAVKNGQTVRLFTDGFVDFTNVPVLKFPDSRFAFAVKFYEVQSGEFVNAYPARALIVQAGRTEMEINEQLVAYAEAELVTKENQ
jgi:hypothetical protein